MKKSPNVLYYYFSIFYDKEVVIVVRKERNTDAKRTT